MKAKNVFWGLLFVCCGALIVLHQLGMIAQIGVHTIVITALMIPLIVASLVKLNYFGIFLPISILSVLYTQPFDLPQINIWAALFTGLLVSIGFSLIFKRKKKRNDCCDWQMLKGQIGNEFADNTVETIDDSVVECSVSFGDSSKYLKSSQLKRANLSCSFGALKVFFDNASLSPEGAVINLNASFSGVELYIPKEWKVKNSIECFLGGVDEKHRSVCVAKDSPALILTGQVKFSGVEIYYV